ncbi:hypothetical protein [Streptococcus ruminantium]|uniref:Uncharacterized protein n=1 Tax=Streptococcus ruminantium TaxID=1917441 RepID=A0ABU1B5Y1_9STRE|nr:hypothetical protein [Streptococcus ruminantium]MDQ8760241.1 hypothetical protein [Streptococcus ruminantium]MDQ8765513.1 hypothetical protein [Streptococcus ruminantium]MDQ8767457.1 hypothetical protein [Streptococcus ruminantium]MDQ8769808.1 hypothetical protein [Streptococcus ruminantium]MDQ8775599.1 hypothetical protein [Streptococcus ruminantium]
MYLLVFLQSDREIKVGLFENIHQGREFVRQIPGYVLDEHSEFINEFFNPAFLPEYLELHYNGHIVPMTRFMFLENENVSIIWDESTNLSENGKGTIGGSTRVDAYSINNEEVFDYISKREGNYGLVKAFLEEKGYLVDRAFLGSEDGEAILYKKERNSTWKFLVHMDPSFVADADIIKNISEEIED